MIPSFKFLTILLLVLALTFSADAASDRQMKQQRDTSSYSTGSSSGKIKTPKNIRSEAGLNIPAWGVAIDAVYDPRLDNLVPGYKLLNIILTNRGASTIYLDPQKDKWSIRDNLGKLVVAVNHVRQLGDKVWTSLPPGLQAKLEYPSAVRVGFSTKIDVLFSRTVELSNFREIIWHSNHFQKEFNIYTMTGKDADHEKEERIPQSPTYEQAREKYEGVPPVKQNDTLGGVHDADGNKEEGKRRTPFDPELDNLTIPMN